MTKTNPKEDPTEKAPDSSNTGTGAPSKTTDEKAKAGAAAKLTANDESQKEPAVAAARKPATPTKKASVAMPKPSSYLDNDGRPLYLIENSKGACGSNKWMWSNALLISKLLFFRRVVHCTLSSYGCNPT